MTKTGSRYWPFLVLALIGLPASIAAQESAPTYRVLAVESATADCRASLRIEHERLRVRASVCVTERTEITRVGEGDGQTPEVAAIEDVVVGSRISAQLMTVSLDGDPEPVAVYARWIRIEDREFVPVSARTHALLGDLDSIPHRSGPIDGRSSSE